MLKALLVVSLLVAGSASAQMIPSGFSGPAHLAPVVSTTTVQNVTGGSGSPSGNASGDLSGMYPGPLVTQARGIRETSGPTTLVVGPIGNGQCLVRSGNTLIGETCPATQNFYSTSDIPGPKGDTGATGPQGPKGDTGLQGLQGVKGDTGLAGSQGQKGDTGLQGIQGVKGDTGSVGPIGPQGPQGVAGVASAVALPFVQTSATSVLTTSATGYGSTSLSLQPGLGVWLVFVSTSVVVPNTATTSLALAVNGVVVTSSERDTKSDGGTLSGTSAGSVVLMSVVTITTASDVVDLRWKQTANLGSSSMGARTIVALKL